VFDACANGQTLKCLTVLDEFTRECPAIDVGGSIRSSRVIEVLSKLVSERGAPRYLRSDNGSEFISRAILRWLAGDDPRGEFPNQLYINPEECIDCGICEPECPWEAIFEGEAVPDVFKDDIALNARTVERPDDFAVPEVVEKLVPIPDEVRANKRKWGFEGYAEGRSGSVPQGPLCRGC